MRDTHIYTCSDRHLCSSSQPRPCYHLRIPSIFAPLLLDKKLHHTPHTLLYPNHVLHSFLRPPDLLGPPPLILRTGQTLNRAWRSNQWCTGLSSTLISALRIWAVRQGQLTSPRLSSMQTMKIRRKDSQSILQQGWEVVRAQERRFCRHH